MISSRRSRCTFHGPQAKNQQTLTHMHTAGACKLCSPAHMSPLNEAEAYERKKKIKPLKWERRWVRHVTYSVRRVQAYPAGDTDEDGNNHEE